MTTTHYWKGHRVIEVDTRKAQFKGLRWSELGAFGKKKFDNWIFLNNVKNEGAVRTKIIYI